MTKQQREHLYARAQALRDSGMSTSKTAKALGMSIPWVQDHTKGPLLKHKDKVRERCATFFAYALSRDRERRAV